MSKLLLASCLALPLAGLAVLPMQGCSMSDAGDDTPARSVRSALSDGGDDGGSALRGALVISQVYGGGGETGASFDHDFVELFNRSKDSLLLDGLSLQVATSTANFGAGPTDIVPLSGTLPSGAYLLIALESAAATGDPLPTPDLSSDTTGLGAADGKVALAPSIAPLGCGGAVRCASTKVIDLVGYGAATDSEGAQRAPALDPKKAAIRAGKGCTDTNDNAADFTADVPTPRNAASTPFACPGAAPSPPPKEAGAPPPPVKDGPLGAEEPFDAGAKKDAGSSKAAPAGAESSGCSLVAAPDGRAAPLVSLAVAVGLVAARRRRSARR